MATLFRKSRSPFWYAAYFDSEGRRHYRSTKKRNRTEAVKAAAELELAARRTTATDDGHHRHLLAILEEATICAVRGKLTEAAARQFLSRIHEAAAGEKLDESRQAKEVE